jgi:hypothetical protein
MSWPLLVFFISVQIPLDDDPAYKEGMRLYEDFEYERAVFRFKEALRVKDRTNSDRAVIGLRLGMTYAELRDDQGALDAFEAALTEDPLLVLPSDASPKIKDMLDQARQAVRGKRGTGKTPPPVTSPPVKPPAGAKSPSKLENLPPAGKPSAVKAGTPPSKPPATAVTQAPTAPAAAAPAAKSETAIEPVPEVAVQEEVTEDGGLPLLMISGATVGVLGVVGLVAGGTSLGVAVYYYLQATDPNVYADDYEEYASIYNTSLVAGFVLGAVGLVTVLTGAALGSSSILTGEFDDGGETAETAPLPIDDFVPSETAPAQTGAGQ